MSPTVFRITTLILLTTLSMSQAMFNISQINKYGNQSIYETTCNKDTQIDFFFSSQSKMACSATPCTVTNPTYSSMKFFDINGNDLNLNLASAQAVSNAAFIVHGFPTSIPIDYHYAFRFADSYGHQVFVLQPITIVAANQIFSPSIVNVNNYTQSAIFDGFKSPSGATTVDLSLFNFLNSPDYNRFYHVTSTDTKSTLLISATILRLSGRLLNPIGSSAQLTAFTPNYGLSGNKLCYASNQTSGLFQTHLRESWPLWTWVIAIMLYWIYYLLADSQTNSCYDARFNDNKLTCWGFYSLHHLGHVEYFSRLSRLSLLFFVFSFQAVVLSALYQTRGMSKAPYTNYQMIIWTAAIALAASLPIPFILGNIFFRNIYNLTLQKFECIKKTRGMILNKSAQQQALIQHEVDRLQQGLYSYYYIFYVLVFIGMVCFWVPSIYMMMQIHRDWYYLQRIWLASLAITFVLDNLIFDPLLSVLLGNTAFYRNRGYFYRFQLGKAFKQIEQ